ncbi:hypothetical protein OK016_07010 [Vibrio chagasii]|nr:hypothetical protein [Vibrio chagasii]
MKVSLRRYPLDIEGRLSASPVAAPAVRPKLKASGFEFGAHCEGLDWKQGRLDKRWDMGVEYFISQAGEKCSDLKGFSDW